MSKYLVFGHKNPDTDAIASAIAFSYFLEKTGNKAEAVALGEANDETRFALDYFNVEQPRVVETVANETERVALVDHNEVTQSVSDIADVEVDYVVDHHRIANFETSNPLFYRAEPIGSTASVLFKLFKESDIEIPKDIAGLMLSAIISDTLLLKSPTTTSQDKEIAKKLAKIAEVDLDEYGLALLKAGTNLSNKTATELVNLDAKTFNMNDNSVRIGQVNAIGFDEMLNIKEQLLEEMQKEISVNNYDLFVLLVTDILESNSFAFVLGGHFDEVKEAFKQEVVDNFITLDGVVSRKKQIVPQLTEAFLS
ncbi:manganese-dependent inorganic pyrophosphatase [Aerococcaceae bacterium WGS1372]